MVTRPVVLETAAVVRKRRLFATWIFRLCRSWPMTVWVTLLLLAGLYARSVVSTLHVWVTYLPGFLLLDLIRRWMAPSSAEFLGWFRPALAVARRGEPYELPPGRQRRLTWFYTGLGGLAIYLLAFVFLPFVRVPAESVAHQLVVRWLYRTVGTLYPPSYKEPAHIMALGHVHDALALQHYIVLALIFSAATLFIYRGPGLREFAARTILKQTPDRVLRGRRPPDRRDTARIGIYFTSISIACLYSFGILGTADAGLEAYWRIWVFPPSVIFLVNLWLFSFSISLLGLTLDLDDASQPWGHHTIRPKSCAKQ